MFDILERGRVKRERERKREGGREGGREGERENFLYLILKNIIILSTCRALRSTMLKKVHLLILVFWMCCKSLVELGARNLTNLAAVLSSQNMKN